MPEERCFSFAAFIIKFGAPGHQPCKAELFLLRGFVIQPGVTGVCRG